MSTLIADEPLPRTQWWEQPKAQAPSAPDHPFGTSPPSELATPLEPEVEDLVAWQLLCSAVAGC